VFEVVHMLRRANEATMATLRSAIALTSSHVIAKTKISRHARIHACQRQFRRMLAAITGMPAARRAPHMKYFTPPIVIPIALLVIVVIVGLLRH
jgi:hypothetical protein